LGDLGGVHGVDRNLGDLFLLVPLLRKLSATVHLLEGDRWFLLMVCPALEALMIDLTSDADMCDNPE
jgi:hypothetical protein